MRRDRVENLGGGIVVYIRDSHTIVDKSTNYTNEWETFTLIVEKRKLNFLCYYRPPHYKLNDLEKMFDSTDLNFSTFLIGDLNYNFFSDDSLDLKAIFDQFGFENFIKCPTRITDKTSTSLDVIAGSCNPSLILKTGAITVKPISDHELVFAVVNL